MVKKADKTQPIDPIELVVVQATSFCNLNCSYCYLSEETRRASKKIPLSDILDYLSKIISSRYLSDRLIISWHSGEPLVIGPAYYEAIIAQVSQIVRKIHGPTFEVFHDFQTNGTLIDEEWCAFFTKYRDTVTVGVSCDGPEHMHDAFRRDWRGSGTFERTVRGIDLLIKSKIKFGLIAVVSPSTLRSPDEFFNFFYSYRQYVSEFRFNLLDEFSEVGEFSYENASDIYYVFLKTILDRIKSLDPPEELINIKNFSYFYDHLFAPPSERWRQTADHMSRPFRAINIATNGDVSTFYAGVTIDECEDVYGDGKGLVLGNLKVESLDDIARSPKLADLYRNFRRSHRACQETCPYFELCPGGYSLIKYKRFGTFDVAETPECRIQVQTFANALIDHISEHINSA